MEVLNDTTPTTRKEHRCDNCGRVIRAGETYRRTDGNFEGEMTTWKSCAHCNAVLDRIWATDPDARYWDDGVDLQEYLREYEHTELAAQMHEHWRGVDVETLRPLNFGASS